MRVGYKIKENFNQNVNIIFNFENCSTLRPKFEVKSLWKLQKSLWGIEFEEFYSKYELGNT